MPNLDLNCDMGEGFGIYRAGDDESLLEHISSANIACGFHAGDPSIMALTVKAAAKRGVAIGAHPSLPDMQGFGRRVMAITPSEAYDIVVYQIGALLGVATAAGATLRHVKPHGVLYTMAAQDHKLACAIAKAVRDIDPALIVFGMQGTEMVHAAQEYGIHMAYEVYADRTYRDDGSLTPRNQPGALITDIQQSLMQVRQMVVDGCVRTTSGKEISMRADTLCIHGDQPGAVLFARELRSMLQDVGVEICAPTA